MSDPRYPIGKAAFKPGQLTAAERRELISHIRSMPEKLEAAVHGLSDQQLATPYREGGWQICQVVHHLADSHMHAYVRCKLAATEDKPTIMTYDGNLWAGLGDARSVDVAPSLHLVRSLHARWSQFFDALRPEDFGRTFVHPERGILDIDWMLQLYGWHSRHHVAQITTFRERMSW